MRYGEGICAAEIKEQLNRMNNTAVKKGKNKLLIESSSDKTLITVLTSNTCGEYRIKFKEGRELGAERVSSLSDTVLIVIMVITGIIAAAIFISENRNAYDAAQACFAVSCVLYAYYLYSYFKCIAVINSFIKAIILQKGGLNIECEK